MEIKKAQFVVSSSKTSQCPKADYPEYAFIGRSNVGKSSLINMICNHKNLAKVSGTPGKTQLINHFLIDQKWYLVDLPGYGYAKVAKTVKSTFATIITDYLLNRPNIMNLFVLVDCRHEPQKIDIEFMQWLGEHQIPFTIVFTKADKLKPQALIASQQRYEQTLLTEWEELPPIIITSADKSIGRQDILNYIGLINNHWMPLQQK